MAEKFKLEFKTSLQDLSITAICQYLWEIPSVKEKIKKHFIDCKEYENWHEVTKYVLNCSKLMLPGHLPGTLEILLNDAIVNIGERIANWIRFLVKIMHIDFSYSDKIYLTKVGTIDENKIFDLFWVGQYDMNENAIINKKMFLLACVFVKIDFIEKYSNKFLKEIKNYPVSKKIVENYNDTNYLIITAWLCYFILDQEEVFKISWQLNNLLLRFKRLGIYMKPSDMYQVCAAVGFGDAAEYYLNMLDECERNILIPHVAEKCTKKIKEDEGSYKKDKLVDISVRMLNRLTEQDRRLFIFKYRSDFLQLLLNWPLQIFFHETIENYFLCLKDYNLQNYLRCFLKVIINDILSDFKNKLPIKRTSLRNALQKTWSKIAEIEKASICINEVILNHLLEIEDFSSLKLLIDVKYPPDDVDITFYSISSDIKGWVLSGDFYMLSRFENEVFDSDEERIIFKEKIFQYIEELIVNDNFDLADRFLDWASLSGDDRELLKNKIEPKYIIRSLISTKSFTTIEKFLFWRYESEEEIKNVKDLLKIDLFIRTKIYTIWGEGNPVVECQKDSFQIMEYFCQSEFEILKYKNEMLMKDETSVFDFVSNLVNIHKSENFSIIEDFLKFCELTSEKEKEIKEKIVEKILEYMNYFAIKLNSLNVADDLLNWILRDEADRKKIIGNFMNSQKGIILCNGMININEWGNGINDKKINEWLKTVLDIKALKNDLIRLNSNFELREKIISIFEAFETLNRGQVFDAQTQVNFYQF